MVRGAARTGRNFGQADETVTMGDIDAATDWRAALESVDQIVHCAARVHVLRDEPLGHSLYTRTNVDGTERLAVAAARAGVRRFVYLSSAKVLGESTGVRVFSNRDRPAPVGPYAESKSKAEGVVRAVADATGMQAVIIRPPLVYGPGVGANFLSLIRWVASGVPLPLGSIQNRRSYVYVGNLVDLVTHTLCMRDIPSEPLLVSDGDDLSTPEMISRLCGSLNVPNRLWSVPAPVLRGLCRLAGRLDEYERLVGSLQVDLCGTLTATGWGPPFSVQHGLADTAAWFRSGRVNV